MSTKPTQWVVPTDNWWGVRRSGSDRLTTQVDTQSEAITIAREIAQNQRTELFIQGRDGKIRERDSFWNDPYPPKG